ncbi:MAG TPA: HAMP domain-containing methyl-accepting chemotaxis protein, partial [Xanthobacteraceae bacterium]|nr:HAMP domain-containing methyl-accepting chemotaxis protein [Xanthobacteraceae bacterium]
MAIRMGIGLKLGIASGIVILLSGGIIFSQQYAASQIAAADKAAETESDILSRTQQVGFLLGQIQVNANDIRLAVAGWEVDVLLGKISIDMSAAKTELDKTIALITEKEAADGYRRIKARLSHIDTGVAEIAATQKAEIASFAARNDIITQWDPALRDLRNEIKMSSGVTTAQASTAEAALMVLDEHLRGIDAAAWRFATTGDGGEALMVDEDEQRGQAALDLIATSIASDGAIAGKIAAIGGLFKDYIVAARDAFKQVQIRKDVLEQRLRPGTEYASAQIKAAVVSATARSKALDEVSSAELSSGLLQILALTIIAIAAAIASAAYSVVAIARPIKHLSSAMEQVSSGDFAAQIPYARRNDELGDQARALTVFRDGLAEAEHMRQQRSIEERQTVERRKAEMRALADQFESAIGAVVDTVASAATELQQAAETLSSTAEETTAQAAAVASAAGLATTNVQSVASAVEELSASARAIGERLRQSTQMTERAVTEVDNTNGQMGELRACADQIGSIVSVIDTLAGQTNLLALNATIESARAGEAGRGFAVVAQEVKQLAGQTAKATADIAERVSGIQESTGDVLGAITGFSRTIVELNAGSLAIAAAMDEQNATTGEVAR